MLRIKNIIILTIVVSFLTSSLVGFISGSMASNLVAYWLQKHGISLEEEKEVGEREEQKESQYPEYVPRASEEQAVIEAVKEVSPTVVSIIVTKDLPVIEQYYIDPFQNFWGDDFFDDFFSSPFRFQVPQYREKGTEKREIGGGTGFIISSDGLILTNKHVVSDKEAEYTVLTNREEKYQAQVLARDPIRDFAILKIDGEGFTPAILGDSDKLIIGQTVITIGNALGEFRNTVSRGVISGLSRSVVASGGGVSEELTGVIQTDAAINQGNSGGPLINLEGEVVGVNTAMAMGAENIGFAIPINEAKENIEDVKKYGEIRYAFLGVRFILVNKTIQEKNNLPVDYGALVARGEEIGDLAVIPGSPADKAGIEENDIILEIEGTRVDQKNTLAKLIQKYEPGDEVEIKILHKGKEKLLKVELGERSG